MSVALVDTFSDNGFQHARKRARFIAPPMHTLASISVSKRKRLEDTYEQSDARGRIEQQLDSAARALQQTRKRRRVKKRHALDFVQDEKSEASYTQDEVNYLIKVALEEQKNALLDSFQKDYEEKLEDDVNRLLFESEHLRIAAKTPSYYS